MEVGACYKIMYYYRSTLITDCSKTVLYFFNHSLCYDLAPRDFYLFSKLYLPMKGKRFDDTIAIQNAPSAILKDISKDDL